MCWTRRRAWVQALLLSVEANDFNQMIQAAGKAGQGRQATLLLVQHCLGVQYSLSRNRACDSLLQCYCYCKRLFVRWAFDVYIYMYICLRFKVLIINMHEKNMHKVSPFMHLQRADPFCHAYYKARDLAAANTWFQEQPWLSVDFTIKDHLLLVHVSVAY